jgi:hypothetical protein
MRINPSFCDKVSPDSCNTVFCSTFSSIDQPQYNFKDTTHSANKFIRVHVFVILNPL